jgi:hypothetical protein
MEKQNCDGCCIQCPKGGIPSFEHWGSEHDELEITTPSGDCFLSELQRVRNKDGTVIWNLFKGKDLFASYTMTKYKFRPIAFPPKELLIASDKPGEYFFYRCVKNNVE